MQDGCPLAVRGQVVAHVNHQGVRDRQADGALVLEFDLGGGVTHDPVEERADAERVVEMGVHGEDCPGLGAVSQRGACALTARGHIPPVGNPAGT